MSLLDSVVGFIGGGPARVDAAGAAALAVKKVENARSSVLNKVEQFGAKLGPTWGSEIFSRLFKGADAPAQAAVQARQQELFGINTQTIGIAGVVIAAISLFVMMRKK